MIRRRRRATAPEPSDAALKRRPIAHGQTRADGKKKALSCIICYDDCVTDGRTGRVICGSCIAKGMTFEAYDATDKEGT